MSVAGSWLADGAGDGFDRRALVYAPPERLDAAHCWRAAAAGAEPSLSLSKRAHASVANDKALIIAGLDRPRSMVSSALPDAAGKAKEGRASEVDKTYEARHLEPPSKLGSKSPEVTNPGVRTSKMIDGIYTISQEA
jgi:hypothetical protein